MQRFLETRQNDFLTLPESVHLSTDVACVLQADTLIISIDAQGLRALLVELAALPLENKTVVLCMKGVEISTGMRLSEIAKELLPESCAVAVWLGPGHVQSFFAGIPNCMVIDSENEDVKRALVEDFSGEVIRLYYGEDLVGNEIGGAAKNVIGIAAGMLDGAGLSSLNVLFVLKCYLSCCSDFDFPPFALRLFCA
jgi:glycerol-3-phosphate dehydrogenase (NAD(P)+)